MISTSKKARKINSCFQPLSPMNSGLEKGLFMIISLVRRSTSFLFSGQTIPHETVHVALGDLATGVQTFRTTLESFEPVAGPRQALQAALLAQGEELSTALLLADHGINSTKRIPAIRQRIRFLAQLLRRDLSTVTYRELSVEVDPIRIPE